MKKITHLLTLSLLLTFLSTSISAAPKMSPAPVQEELGNAGIEHFQDITLDEFLELTPRKIKEKTGQKLSLKQAVMLKAAQKKIRKELKKGGTFAGGKDQLVALVLVLLFGLIGVHRFYLGYIGIGILQIVTLGGCGIWALIDMIRIITGDLQPKNGVYDETL